MLWINKKFSINTVHMWRHKNSSNRDGGRVQNGVSHQSSETTWFWHILTVKRWTRALSERFFPEEMPSCFNKPAPKSNSQCLATCTRRKSRSFSVWVRYLKKKIALIGHAEWCTRHRVVCFTLVYAQSRARKSAAIFIF